MVVHKKIRTIKYGDKAEEKTETSLNNFRSPNSTNFHLKNDHGNMKNSPFWFLITVLVFAKKEKKIQYWYKKFKEIQIEET